MPNSKDTMEKLTKGWSLEDMIEELKGKYHLRKKDWESYWEQSKQEMRMNEQFISSLRRSNKAKRILLAQDENADERVIQTVFRDDRNERLSLQRFTANEAIENTDQTVCEKANFLNSMRYEKEKREQKLQELSQELERMYHMEKQSSENIESEHTSTKLENSLDKALIKYDTARIITKKYEDILDKLKEESLTLPAKLDTMEQGLRQQKAELKELNELSKEAISVRDSAKSEFSVVEQIAYEARKQRESELNATRKEVERRKNDAEKVDKKTARSNLISDQSDQKSLQETQMKLEKQNRILLYENTMEKIKMATHVTDIEDVVDRIKTQKQTQKSLKSTVQEMEGQRNRLKEDVEKLNTQYHDMKYSGEHKVSCGEAKLEDLNKHIEMEKKNLMQLNATYKRNNKTAVGVGTGISTLIDKLTSVRLPPPHHNFTDGDIYDQLQLCINKSKHLLKDVERMDPTQNVDSVEMQDPEFQDFLVMQINHDNIRIKMQVSETELSEFDYDGQENDVLERTDIKKIGQDLIDSQKPKKKKGKKK